MSSLCRNDFVKASEKTIDIESENFEMIYHCSSNRYVFNYGVDQTKQISGLHSLVNFSKTKKGPSVKGIEKFRHDLKSLTNWIPLLSHEL